MFLSLYTERRPIGLRSPPDWIAFGARSDCVRRPTTRRELLAVGGYGIPAVAISRYNYYWQ